MANVTGDDFIIRLSVSVLLYFFPLSTLIGVIGKQGWIGWSRSFAGWTGRSPDRKITNWEIKREFVECVFAVCVLEMGFDGYLTSPSSLLSPLYSPFLKLSFLLPKRCETRVIYFRRNR